MKTQRIVMIAATISLCAAVSPGSAIAAGALASVASVTLTNTTDGPITAVKLSNAGEEDFSMELVLLSFDGDSVLSPGESVDITFVAGRYDLRLERSGDVLATLENVAFFDGEEVFME